MSQRTVRLRGGGSSGTGVWLEGDRGVGQGSRRGICWMGLMVGVGNRNELDVFADNGYTGPPSVAGVLEPGEERMYESKGGNPLCPSYLNDSDFPTCCRCISSHLDLSRVVESYRHRRCCGRCRCRCHCHLGEERVGRRKL